MLRIEAKHTNEIPLVRQYVDTKNNFYSTRCNTTFTAQTTYSTGSGSDPASVLAVDVNNDTKPDIIVGNYGQNNVGIFLNSGNGTFLVQKTYSTGSNSDPNFVSVVDVNSDRKPDIIVSNELANNVGVLFNAGNGTFLPQTTYPIGSDSNPAAISVVDVNSDNKSDIIVANSGTNNVGVLLNSRNGTFLSQTTYSTGSNSNPQAVFVADINNDRKPDIIVANSGSNNVGVLLNSGNGTFLLQTTYSTGSGSEPLSVSVADVNGDSKPDIIVANTGLNNVGVLLNFGNGTFLTQTTYSTGSNSGPIFVAVADVNNDNKPDIIVANYGTDNVGVLLNSGNGTFLTQKTYPAGTKPLSVSVVDVNSDSKPDIIVANIGDNNVGVFLAC